MAKPEVTDWDETDSGNTDVSGIGLSDATLIDKLDDIGRAIMGAVKRFFRTNLFRLRDASDQTKLLAFGLSSLTTATTRTLTVQDKDGTIALTSDTALRGLLYGLIPTNNAADATNDIEVSVGDASSDAATPVVLSLASTIIKRLDANWAVGTNQGGLDTGSVGNSIYYVWVIGRSDTGVVDILLSLSSTAPTMPTNYDRKRVIGSFARAGGVNKAPRAYSVSTTDWVAYTPTWTGFGTVTDMLSVFSRRVGDSLEVQGYWTSGTTTADEAQMTLGFGGTNGNVVTSTAKIPALQLAGFGSAGSASAVAHYTALSDTAVGYLSFGRHDNANGGLVKASGGTIFNNGAKYSYRASIPIQGW